MTEQSRGDVKETGAELEEVDQTLSKLHAKIEEKLSQLDSLGQKELADSIRLGHTDETVIGEQDFTDSEVGRRVDQYVALAKAARALEAVRTWLR